MLCKKCNTENLLKADYCQACGNKFTQEEKDDAYGKTIFGKFEKLEEYISYLKPVELIKGNKFFRIGVLVVIVLYSLFVLKTNGNNLRIEESSNYEVLMNKDTQAYFLVSETASVNVDLHIPRKAESLTVYNVDNNGEILYSENYALESGLSLAVSEDYHYVIQANFEKDVQSIEVYVVTP